MRRHVAGLLLTAALAACGTDQPPPAAAQPPPSGFPAAATPKPPTPTIPPPEPTSTATPAPPTATIPPPGSPGDPLGGSAPPPSGCAAGTAGSFAWPSRLPAGFAVRPEISQLYAGGSFELYLFDQAGARLLLTTGGLDAPDDGGAGARTAITVRGLPGGAYEGAHDRIIDWEEGGRQHFLVASAQGGPAQAELLEVAAGLELIDSDAWCERLAAAR